MSSTSNPNPNPNPDPNPNPNPNPNQELMSAIGQDIHTIPIWDDLVGLTLDQAAKLVPTAIIVGVLRSRPGAAAELGAEDGSFSDPRGLSETLREEPSLEESSVSSSSKAWELGLGLGLGPGVVVGVGVGIALTLTLTLT